MQDDETGTGSADGDGGPAGGFGDAGEPQGATLPGEPQDVTGPEGTADGGLAAPGGAGAGPAQGDVRVSRRRQPGRIAVYALVAVLAAGLGAAATSG